MATTRIMPMHMNKGKTLLQSITDRTDYAMNPDKTDGGLLVSAYECDPDSVEVDFLLAKEQYRAITGREPKNGKDVIAYHLRQSFYPGEITPEEANRMGYELARRFTEGKHQFIVATHIDKAHVHNWKTAIPLLRIRRKKANPMRNGMRKNPEKAGRQY